MEVLMKKLFVFIAAGAIFFTSMAAYKLPLYNTPEWHAMPGMEELKNAAKEGDFTAMSLMAMAVKEGKILAGLPLDTIDLEWELKLSGVNAPPEKKYLASLRKYAESGSYIAQRTLGGELWKKGDHNCLVWYRKAADQGDDVAQFNLGLAHLDGTFGAEVNPAETLKLWLLSAAQGNAGALKDLGVFWKDGLSGKKNLAKGIDFLKLAVEKGSTTAAFLLGEIYSEGRGVPVNMTLAAKYFRKAAEKESDVALQNSRTADMHFNTAMDYLQEENIHECNNFLESAASYGHKKAPVIRLRNDISYGDKKTGTDALVKMISLAENGNAYAQATLALSFNAINQPEEAAAWYCRSLGNGETLAFTVAPEILSTKFTDQQKNFLRGVFLRADYLDETEMQYIAFRLCDTENFPEMKEEGIKYFKILLEKSYPKILYPYLIIALEENKNIPEAERMEIILALQEIEEILKNLAAGGDKSAAEILNFNLPNPSGEK